MPAFLTRCAEHADSSAAIRLLSWPSRARFAPQLCWTGLQSILVVKLDEIGDYVLATPFLRELRRNVPEARITLVTNPTVAPLARTNPAGAECLSIDLDTRGRRGWRLRRQWRAWLFARRYLRPRHYDLAIIPRLGVDVHHATALAAYSAPNALVTYPEAAEPLRARLNQGFDALATHLAPAPYFPRHEVEANLDLLRFLAGDVQNDRLEIRSSEGDRAEATALFPPARRFAVLAPGASDWSRRWPAKAFEQIARTLRDQHHLEVVTMGAATDPFITGTRSLLGQTSLPLAKALLERASLFVGNDSGLKHLAASAGCPVVEISALRSDRAWNHTNSPARFRAWQVPQRILQPPPGPHDLAIEEVQPNEVDAACASLLAQIGA